MKNLKLIGHDTSHALEFWRERMPDMNCARSGHSLTYVPNPNKQKYKLYAIGGLGASHRQDPDSSMIEDLYSVFIEIYDSQTKQWQLISVDMTELWSQFPGNI